MCVCVCVCVCERERERERERYIKKTTYFGYFEFHLIIRRENNISTLFHSKTRGNSWNSLLSFYSFFILYTYVVLPPTDSFVVSQLFRVARHFKLRSKPPSLYVTPITYRSAKKRLNISYLSLSLSEYVLIYTNKCMHVCTCVLTKSILEGIPEVSWLKR